jgi:hypothetical protein
VDWVLAILGVIVGLLNIGEKDSKSFLIAAIALILSASALNVVPVLGPAFESMLPLVVTFVAGAMIVVSI